MQTTLTESIRDLFEKQTTKLVKVDIRTNKLLNFISATPHVAFRYKTDCETRLITGDVIVFFIMWFHFR